MHQEISHQTTNGHLIKTQTTEIYVNQNNQRQLMNDSIEVPDQKKQGKKSEDENYQRKDLHWIFFLGIIAIEITFTLYPSFIFRRANGTYEFAIMQFTFPIGFIFVSRLLLKDKKQMLKQYFLLDAIMIVALCLVATYIFPYVAMKRVSADQIFQQIGFFICNIAMIGNFRIITKYMKWTVFRVVLYKISKIFQILFYLVFGAYYILANISYSKKTDDTLDGQVQDLVILFVFTGFALQFQVYNKTCDFDKTGDLEAHYQIKDEDQKQNQKLKQSQVQAKNNELQPAKGTQDTFSKKLNQSLNKLKVVKGKRIQ